MHLGRVVSMVAAVMSGLLASGCSRPAEYEIRGQILHVDAARQEITVKHDDIRGFMPAMTMPFKVREPGDLEGRVAGELIRATLVVEASQGYLRGIEHTGVAPLSDAPPVGTRVEPLAPGEAVPGGRFVDQQHSPRTLGDWRGRALAVTFVYTRCPMPDFCPLIDRQFAAVRDAVAADDRLRGRVQLISVTIDPVFDTPAVLAAHARTLGATPDPWSFLTGERRDVEHFAAQFGVSVTGDTSAPADLLHNLRTAVITPGGRLLRIFSGNEWRPDDLVGALREAYAGG